MSRTLSDDFDEDDLPGGSLDLEKGSSQVGTGAPSSYGGGEGIDFDDGFDEAGPAASLELDMPPSSNRGGLPAPQHAAPPQVAPPQPSRGSQGGPAVPDLAFDAMPPKPAAQSSGKLPGAPAPPAQRTSGQQPAVRPPVPPPPGSDGHNGFAPPASSSNAVSTMAPLEPPQSSGQLPAAHANGPGEVAAALPPAKPTPAALIARYPAPPVGIANAAMYAIRVFMRQLELRTDLESLRRRRSPDVPLYEAALKAYDAKTFRLGVALCCAAFAVTTFIVFLPVIFRFMRD